MPTINTVPKKNPIVNRAQVKKLALRLAQSAGRKFTRVSDNFITECEEDLRTIIASRVHRHPSIGVTLKGQRSSNN